MALKASVIISTYNSEMWLEKVLWGYSLQTATDFEIVIADDGSRATTKELIDLMREHVPFPIQHVWQEDNGFQKSRILNKAILAAQSDYLIFTDGDCIPRKDFVQTHLDNRQPGRFLSGGYFMLPLMVSQMISREDILSQNCFDIRWLIRSGVFRNYKNLKISANGFLARLLNRVTTTKPTWNGHNSSGWKRDIVAVNGFNQAMQYGGQDRELGERLSNNGIQGLQIRYSAKVIHLEHSREYVTQEMLDRSFSIRQNTQKQKLKWTEDGLQQAHQVK